MFTIEYTYRITAAKGYKRVRISLLDTRNLDYNLLAGCNHQISKPWQVTQFTSSPAPHKHGHGRTRSSVWSITRCIAWLLQWNAAAWSLLLWKLAVPKSQLLWSGSLDFDWQPIHSLLSDCRAVTDQISTWQVNFGTDSDFVREIENMCSSFVTWWAPTARCNHRWTFPRNSPSPDWFGHVGSSYVLVLPEVPLFQVGHFLHVEARVGGLAKAMCAGKLLPVFNLPVGSITVEQPKEPFVLMLMILVVICSNCFVLFQNSQRKDKYPSNIKQPIFLLGFGHDYLICTCTVPLAQVALMSFTVTTGWLDLPSFSSRTWTNESCPRNVAFMASLHGK